MKRLFERITLCLSLSLALSSLSTSQAIPTEKRLVIPPYIQIGSSQNNKELNVVFGVDSQTNGWTLEYKQANETEFRQAKIEESQLNGNSGLLKLLNASLSGLKSNLSVDYRVKLNNNEVFSASTKALPAPNNETTFAVMGDCGHGSVGEKKVARELALKQPSMTVIAGDIVYPIGTVQNYLKNFFPFFHTLMKSCIFVACPGNHDIASGGMQDARNLDASPDSMAYFTLWKQPLNGPITKQGNNCPEINGNTKNKDAFLKAAGSSYPRMANFSYDYGDSHWLILDGNQYVDWKNKNLQNWVDKDLSTSQRKWKFVVMHQPGFSSDWHHREEQQMRLLADIFEKNKVDIVFSGHSHSYQRSYPLHFKLAAKDMANPDREAKSGFVYGSFELDKSFDGDKNKTPNGVIYIVSGAGGAPLSMPELQEDPTRLQPFTVKFVSKKHSFSLCQIKDGLFSLEQITEDGKVIDKITINK